MIIVFKPNSPDAEIKKVEKMVADMGYEPRLIRGVEHTVLGAVGDENMHMSLEALRNLSCIADVHPIQKKYKLSSREIHPDNSVVNIGKEQVGGKKFMVIAGPCAIESEEQMEVVAQTLKADGVSAIRGGAFKPRTSPYDFQGLGQKGLDILQHIKTKYDIPVVTEVVGIPTIEAVAKVSDCIQIGARNCQNFNLLENVAKAGRPVLLKRGMSTTIEEWLNAAEYLQVHGCKDVILCERGIRTFETATRNTLDISAVAVVKKESHLPIIIDPSHAAGKLEYVLPLAKAAAAVGADGIIVESHPTPIKALSDAAQQIPCANFKQFLDELRPFVEAAGRTL